MNKELKKPLIDFLELFLHLHQLNFVFRSTVQNYENMVDASNNARRVLSKFDVETKFDNSEDHSDQQKAFVKTVQKEISENYYTLKSSEIILLYSRLESAISETIHLVFQKTDLKKIKELESIKINAVSYLRMSKKERCATLADQYMFQMTQSIKYGFTRFEATLKPIFGESNLSKENRDRLFKLAQVRNLLVHKNGIIDKQFKQLFKAKKYKLGSKIDIDSSMLNEFHETMLSYADNILDRIQKAIESHKPNTRKRSKITAQTVKGDN